MQVVIAALDSTGISGCNPAISSAMEEAQALSGTTAGWARLTELFSLCEDLNDSEPMDVPMFFESVLIAFYYISPLSLVTRQNL